MFFGLFKKGNINKTHSSEADLKWNKMWNLWADGEIESPYNELMAYHSEVNNGGHYQYFLNTEDNGDIGNDVKILCDILPDVLKDNLLAAFKAYSESECNENVNANEKIIEKCDNVFFENEEIINSILENYSKNF